MRLTLITLLTLLTLTLTLTGCGKKEEKIEIGFMGTLSGRYSDLGQGTLQGAMLAVENSPLAEKVNLVVKDDFGKPSEGVRLVSEFSQANIRYLIGPSISSVATAVVPLLESNGIHMLSPTVSTSALAGMKDNFVRIMPHNSYKHSEVISRYLLENVKIKDIVLLYDSRNASYSNDIVKKFTDAFMKEGGTVRDVRSFNPDSGESLSLLLEQDMETPPDMYYIIGSAMDTSLIIWQIKKHALKSKLLIRKWAASNDFYRLGGEAVEGAMVFDYYIDESAPAFQDFNEKYKARFQKTPGWMSIYGYQAAKALLDSIGKVQSGADFTESLRDAVKNSMILTGLQIDEYGDAYLPLNYFVIENGETVRKGKAE